MNRREDTRASEAMQPVVAVVTPVRAEEAASRLPAVERAPRSSVAKPHEETASMAKQTHGRPSLAHLRGVRGLQSPLLPLPL